MAAESTQTNWNGIVGKIELRASSLVYVDDVQIYPNLSDRRIDVNVTVAKHIEDPINGSLTLCAFLKDEAERPVHANAVEYSLDWETGKASAEIVQTGHSGRCPA